MQTDAASLAYRQAAQNAPARPTPGAAFNAARELFRRGERLDMAALATELGIGRATLYRWTGDRDRLLTDVLIAEFEALTAQLDQKVTGRGAARIEEAVGRFVETISTSPAIRAFLAHEGPSGLRLLTLPTSRVRTRMVTELADLIGRETDNGTYRPPAPAPVLADGIVALGERFLHHCGDPSLNPDPATARRIIHLLLRE